MTSKRRKQQVTKDTKTEQSTDKAAAVIDVEATTTDKEVVVESVEGTNPVIESEGSSESDEVSEAPVEIDTANAAATLTVEPEAVVVNDAPVEESVSTQEPALMGKGEAGTVGSVEKEAEDFGNTNLSSLMPTTLDEAPALFDALRAYERDGGKISGANQTQLMASQVRLLNGLVGAMNTPNLNIRKINGEVITYFKRNIKDAFSMRLAYRNLESIALTAPQRELYQSLITLYRTSAERGRKVAGEEVDLPRIRNILKEAYPRLEHAASILPELFK